MSYEPPTLWSPESEVCSGDKRPGTVQQKKDINSVGWGLLVSFFLHLLLFWVVPWKITPTLSTDWAREREIEYVYADSLPQPKEKRFVETNPEVPTNEPDKTENFAARAQQAAQEKDSPPSPHEIPFREGEEEDSSKIVKGDLLQNPIPPTVLFPLGSETPAEPTAVEGLSPSFPPVPEIIQQEAKTEEGLASMLEEPDKGKERVDQPSKPEKIPLSFDLFIAEENTNAETAGEAAVPLSPLTHLTQPRERLRLSSNVTPGPIMRSIGRALIIGDIAVSAKFDQFGDYLQRMFDAIGFQFQLLAGRSESARAEVSSRVIVEYKITPQGEVKELKVLHTSAGSVATYICKDAIQSRAPFGPWSEEMIKTLNGKETIRITFIYR